MANKKKPDRVNKEFMIRVTNEEHEEFIRRAKENGYRSVSEFIRSLIATEKPNQDKSVS